jgi:hypothetical protein
MALNGDAFLRRIQLVMAQFWSLASPVLKFTTLLQSNRVLT